MSVHPIRVCIGCSAQDDHPRHQVIVGDGTSVFWHHDCHQLATGCEVCAHQLAASKGAKGDVLRKHLNSLPPKAIEHHEDGTVTITALGEEK